jgi:hypothetical protein
MNNADASQAYDNLWSPGYDVYNTVILACLCLVSWVIFFATMFLLELGQMHKIEACGTDRLCRFLMGMRVYIYIYIYIYSLAHLLTALC